MVGIQLSLFGKMYPEHSQVIMDTIFEPCLKKSQKPIFQCLQVENGRTREWFEGGQFVPLGDCLTLNIGEYPNEESVSTLSEVLEAIVPRKYYLSTTACEGILRRAENRGKKLEDILEEALKAIVEGRALQCKFTEAEDETEIAAGVLWSAGFHGWNSITAAGVELREESAPTLTAGKQADVMIKIAEPPIGVDTYNQCLTGDKAKTLLAAHQDPDGLPCAVYALQGSIIGCENGSGPQGKGTSKDVCFTLETTHRHAVVFALDRASFNQGANALYDFEVSDSGINSTIVAKGPSAVAYEMAFEDFFERVVRRLTPKECERLQGYPDFWTVLCKIENMTDEEYEFFKGAYLLDKRINGKTVKNTPTRKQLVRWYNKLDCDGTRYAQLGNSLAIPCALRVIGYIADYIREGQSDEI